MKSKSLDSLKVELNKKMGKLRQLQEEIAGKKKTEKKLEREARDNFRYVLGGILQNERLIETYPDLMYDLYNLASTRDKIKFVRLGVIDEEKLPLHRQNKIECKTSARSLSEKTATTLSEKDLQVLEKIQAYCGELDPAVKRQLYGRQGEMKVYIGENNSLYISDTLAMELLNKHGFSP